MYNISEQLSNTIQLEQLEQLRELNHKPEPYDQRAAKRAAYMALMQNTGKSFSSFSNE
mgnify:CR=1 FL=1